MDEAGAYFGNDQDLGAFNRATLSVFDSTDRLLGAVDLNPNGNTSVDHHLGLRSSVAFVRARVDYDGTIYALVLDDVSFGAGAPPPPAVPEPGTIALIRILMLLMGLVLTAIAVQLVLSGFTDLGMPPRGGGS